MDQVPGTAHPPDGVPIPMSISDRGIMGGLDERKKEPSAGLEPAGTLAATTWEISKPEGLDT